MDTCTFPYIELVLIILILMIMMIKTMKHKTEWDKNELVNSWAGTCSFIFRHLGRQRPQYQMVVCSNKEDPRRSYDCWEPPINCLSPQHSNTVFAERKGEDDKKSRVRHVFVTEMRTFEL